MTRKELNIKLEALEEEQSKLTLKIKELQEQRHKLYNTYYEEHPNENTIEFFMSDLMEGDF